MNEPHAEPDTTAPTFARLLDAVLRRIDRGELMRFTEELVRISSVYRPEEAKGNEARVARLISWTAADGRFTPPL